MLIKFSNLGSIKTTEIDIRPLTIIIGPNNSNKTYIAYSIYGLLKFLRNRISMPGIKLDRKNGSVSANVDNAFFEKYSKQIDEQVNSFKKTLENYFQDSSRKLFSKTTYEVVISQDDVLDAIRSIATRKPLRMIDGKSVIVTFQNDVLVIQRENKKVHKKIPPSDLLPIQFGLYLELASRIFRRPFLLPAERNAFIITYKMLANRRYSFLKGTQREIFGQRRINQRQLDLFREQGDIRYPEPVEDFLDLLSEIELESNSEPSPGAKKNEFQTLADQIEESIQSGNRTNLQPTKLGKEIKINVKRGLSIDLYNASSSIKQLASLLLYLRHRAAKGDLLIIDEPEMNLHPESQAKFLEVVGMLVNLGVNVLLTTHSPYFMSHLNNLVAAQTPTAGAMKKQAQSLYLKDSRSFLSLEKVSAYQMKDNRLGSLKDKDYGFRWDTLSDVSSDIQQKFFQIHEKGQTTRRASKKK